MGKRSVHIVVFAVMSVMTTPGQNRTVQKWAQEPNAFKGLRFGASLGTAREVFGEGLSEYPSDVPGFYIYKALLKIGATRVTAQLIFTGENGDRKFVGVIGDFPSESYDDMREIFVSRYGSPHSVKQSAVQNGFGGTFPNEFLQWKGRFVTKVVLQKYGSMLNKGFFTVETPAMREFRRILHDRNKDDDL